MGTYAAAAKISELWYFIPVSFGPAVYATMMQAKLNDPQDFERKMAKLYTLMSYLFLMIAVPTYLLAPFLVRLIFSADYLPAV